MMSDYKNSCPSKRFGCIKIWYVVAKILLSEDITLLYVQILQKRLEETRRLSFRKCRSFSKTQ